MSFRVLKILILCWAAIPSSSFAIERRGPVVIQDDDAIIFPRHPVRRITQQTNRSIQDFNKQIIKNFYEAIWINNKTDAIYSYLTKDAHAVINGKHYFINGYTARVRDIQSKNKEYSIVFKDIVAEQNKVAVNVMICSIRINLNKKVCVPNVGIYTIHNRKIVSLVVNAITPKQAPAVSNTMLGFIRQLMNKFLS